MQGPSADTVRADGAVERKQEPAVVAYNHFSIRIRDIENEMSRFSSDFLNMLKRDLLRKERKEESITAAAS